MAYDEDQWRSSFEERIRVLRPHLMPQALRSISLVAWHIRGAADEDPVRAAEDESKAMDIAHRGKARRPSGPG